MLGHVEVDDAPAVVSDDDENKDENKKDAQAHGWRSCIPSAGSPSSCRR